MNRKKNKLIYSHLVCELHFIFNSKRKFLAKTEVLVFRISTQPLRSTEKDCMNISESLQRFLKISLQFLISQSKSQLEGMWLIRKKTREEKSNDKIIVITITLPTKWTRDWTIVLNVNKINLTHFFFHLLCSACYQLFCQSTYFALLLLLFLLSISPFCTLIFCDRSNKMTCVMSVFVEDKQIKKWFLMVHKEIQIEPNKCTLLQKFHSVTRASAIVKNVNAMFLNSVIKSFYFHFILSLRVREQNN